LEIAESLENKKSQSIVLNSLGTTLQRQGKLENAEEIFRESLEIAESLDDKKHESMVLTSLGNVLQRQGKLKEAEAIFLKSWEIEKNLNSKKSQSMVLKSLGSILQKQGKLKEAKEVFSKSLEIAGGMDDKKHESMVLTSLESVLHRRGKLDEAVDTPRLNRSIEEEVKNIFVLKKGTVKRVIRHPKGYLYGFIIPDDGSKDIYFREGFVDPEYLSSLREGSRVECGIQIGARGLLATNMKLIP